MAKYSVEFKLQVVKYVLEGNHGVKTAKKVFGLKSHGDIVKWVNKYQKHGIAGLSRNFSKYDRNFKKTVVEYMRNTHLSLTQTAIHFNLSSAAVVASWDNSYIEWCEEALCTEEVMSNKDKEPMYENVDVKKVIKENEKLRMENAYLKKLNALVQERIKQEKKKK